MKDDSEKPFNSKTSAQRARKQALEDAYSRVGGLKLPVGVLPPANSEVMEGKTVAEVFQSFAKKAEATAPIRPSASRTVCGRIIWNSGLENGN